MLSPPSPTPRLRRQLGLFDAVLIGLGSMLGAGVFVVFGAAARVAGSGLLIGLAIAAVIAYCNAISSARLAALYPESGGAYIYGTRRLGPFWGYLAGWSFIVGKTASCAAIALAFGAYAVPGHARLLAVGAVVVLTGINYLGVQKSAWLTRAIVVVTLAALAIAIVACLAGGQTDVSHLRPFPGTSLHGILQAGGLIFFAFAGYARIATLGEEVREPARTIPRAIAVALAIVFVVYVLVAASTLLAVGAPVLAVAAAPLHAAVAGGSLDGLAPVVRVGAVAATLGSLLALILGVSRTTFALSRDGYLPRQLRAVHPRFGVPHRAELVVGIVVIVLVSVVDLRGAIGFSSFGVLTYYAVANASAFTLSSLEGRPPRWLPLLGLAGCTTLAANLPRRSILGGVLVLGLGIVLWIVREASERPLR